MAWAQFYAKHRTKVSAKPRHEPSVQGDQAPSSGLVPSHTSFQLPRARQTLGWQKGKELTLRSFVLHHYLGFFRNNCLCRPLALELFLPVSLWANPFDITLQSPGRADSVNQVGFKPHTISPVGPTGRTHQHRQHSFWKSLSSGLHLPEAMQNLECICMLLSKTKKKQAKMGQNPKPPFHGYKPRGAHLRMWKAKLQPSFRSSLVSWRAVTSSALSMYFGKYVKCRKQSLLLARLSWSVSVFPNQLIPWETNFSSTNIIQAYFFHTASHPLPPQRLIANKALEVEGSGAWGLITGFQSEDTA